MKTRLGYAIAFTIILVVTSIIPLPELPTPPGPSLEDVFSLSHIVSYIICGYLWLLALGLTIEFLLIAVIIAPLTEIVQIPIPYRYVCINDFISNIIGLIIATFLYIMLSKRYKKKR